MCLRLARAIGAEAEASSFGHGRCPWPMAHGGDLAVVAIDYGNYAFCVCVQCVAWLVKHIAAEFSGVVLGEVSGVYCLWLGLCCAY